MQYSTLVTIRSEIAFLYSAAAPIVPLFDNFSIGPNVAPLSPLNTITSSTLDWFVSHQLTITLSMLAPTSKSVELSCSDSFFCLLSHAIYCYKLLSTVNFIPSYTHSVISLFVL